MAAPASPWRKLARDERGTAVIETAIVLPVLCMLSLGAFEASRMIARNTELQSALDETTAIVLAHAPEDQAQDDEIEAVIEASTGLPDASVSVERKYRCGTADSLVASKGSCSSSAIVASYLQIRLSETYTPRWVSFGIGSPVAFNKTRTVQIA